MPRNLPPQHRMIGEIVQQYQDRIKYLKEKIESQSEEILSLQLQIKLMRDQLCGKVYDV